MALLLTMYNAKIVVTLRRQSIVENKLHVAAAAPVDTGRLVTYCASGTSTPANTVSRDCLVQTGAAAEQQGKVGRNGRHPR